MVSVCCGDAACGGRVSVVGGGMVACCDSRQSCESGANSLFPQTHGNKRSAAQTHLHPPLGRWRSTGKQERRLRTPQRDGLKGHVSNIHSHQSVTFNRAAAESEL